MSFETGMVRKRLGMETCSHGREGAGKGEGPCCALGTRDALILENLSMVDLVARRVAPRLPPRLEFEDLISAGVMGLIDAAQKFDPRRQVRFRTYAEMRVRGAILDHLRSLSWAPRGLHGRAKELEAARRVVEQRKGGRASLSEVAAELDITVGEINRLLANIERLETCELDSAAARANPVDALAEIERKELLDVAWKAVEKLPERQKVVLWLYYCEGLTMKEVGAVLEVNEARASQLHGKAIAAVRAVVAREQGLAGKPPRQKERRVRRGQDCFRNAQGINRESGR